MASKEKSTARPLAIALGTGLALSISHAPIATAEQGNPFAASELSQGYMLAEKHSPEGRCGEGKCGGDKAKDGKCGEGKCGSDKAKKGDCDDADKKAKNGKCGEGKCGASNGEKDSEAKCGEGKCGGET